MPQTQSPPRTQAKAECSTSWQEQIYPILKAADIKHVAYVPDAGHATSIELACADPEMQSVVLTTEE